jgi:hypothetical protein
VGLLDLYSVLIALYAVLIAVWLQMRRERITKTKDKNVYVKNLTDDIDKDRLIEEFRPFGIIQSAHVATVRQQDLNC